ncbi:hypothetical protein SBOR_1975 [Sclerotinia borealis F-4128]|uniref:Uncharacterized protein n=1 Tax=Sclerotinia borealis (strain F-4128) TaxID=1432307 RepID=W9CST4_SCLBF|nr:hypothetical protein SBOR_1975 [Sclerotinia borealis F-4128]
MPNLQSPVPAAQGKIQPQIHRRTHSSTPDTSRTTSPLKKEWAENYFADEVFGGTDQNRIEEFVPLPATSALTSRNISLPSEEETTPSRQSRTNQRSLTQLLPTWTTRQNSQGLLRSADNSPTKEGQHFEYMASLTGDQGGHPRVTDRSKGGRSGWFGGSSTTEVARSEQDGSDSRIPYTRDPSPTPNFERKSTLPVLDFNSTPAKSTGSSVFGFFSSPKTPTKSNQLPSDGNNDEYLALDIHSSLFPSGQADPFSPAAFKNLLVNAEGLLLKLQTAYKLRTLEFHEMKAEKDAQGEELEEAELRAKHLKLQLEDMAKKVTEQDTVMEEIVNQLAGEKQARVEDRDQITSRMKKTEEAASISQHCASCCSTAGEEDLGVPQDTRVKWRKSASSTDLSGESDDDTASGGGESVFSRSRSPTLTVSTVMTRDSTRDSTPDVTSSFGRVGALQKDAQLTSNPTIVVQLKPKPKPKPQTSTFKKILGIGSSEPSPASGCLNCSGQGASMAWDTVGLLRAENKGLKDRVGELEVAVEGALDICGGLFPAGSDS